MFCPQWHLCVLQNQFLQKLRRCCLIFCQVCWPRVVSETCRTPAVEGWSSHSCCKYQFKVFLFYSWYVGRGRVSNCGTRLCLWAQQLYSPKLQSKSSIFELPWQCTTVRREPLSQWKPRSYRATCCLLQLSPGLTAVLRWDCGRGMFGFLLVSIHCDFISCAISHWPRPHTHITFLRFPLSIHKCVHIFLYMYLSC